MMWTTIVNTQMGIKTNGKKTPIKGCTLVTNKAQTVMFQKGKAMTLNSNLYS